MISVPSYADQPPTSKQAFSEVIESSLQGFVAQCWEWDFSPPFGSLVLIEQEALHIIGMVHHIQTGSVDPARVPYPYQKTERELMREQPHIFAFLKTSFSCVTLGYKEGEGDFIYQMAPQPPKIHAFVSTLSTALSTDFFACSDYLYRLCNAPHIQDLEELLLALIGYQERLGMPVAHRIATLDALARCWSTEYHRLKRFIHRAQPFFK